MDPGDECTCDQCQGQQILGWDFGFADSTVIATMRLTAGGGFDILNLEEIPCPSTN